MAKVGKTLKDLGWEMCWDPGGKYPIKDGENLVLESDTDYELWFVSKPKQEDDGKWYVYDIRLMDPFPMFIFGFYEKSKPIFSLDILGDRSSYGSTAIGKAEEFSYWERALEDAEIINYQENLSGMVGDGDAYKYQTDAEAYEDGLKAYFVFSEFGIVGPPFYGATESNCLKSRLFDTSSGKLSDSVVLDKDGDYIGIENFKLSYDFTFNIRFMLSEIKDFVLIGRNDSFSVEFKDETSEFIITISPDMLGSQYNGTFTYQKIKVNEWIDFSIRYNSGTVDIYINGENVFSSIAGVVVNGVEKLRLNHSNIESIGVDGIASVGYALESDFFTYEQKFVEVDYGINSLCNFEKLRDYLVSSPDDISAFASLSKVDFSSYWSSAGTVEGHETLSVLYDSDDYFEIEINRSDVSYYTGSGRIKVENSELMADVIIDKFHKIDSLSGSKYYLDTSVSNIIIGGSNIKISFRTKSELTDMNGVFPLFFPLPGNEFVFYKKSIYPYTDIKTISEFMENNEFMPMGSNEYEIIKDNGSGVCYPRTVDSLFSGGEINLIANSKYTLTNYAPYDGSDLVIASQRKA